MRGFAGSPVGVVMVDLGALGPGLGLGAQKLKS